MPSGSARAVGLFGLHSQTTVAPESATAARMAGPSSANPADSARRGTATTVPPRCSVTTRYIA